ncbi:MAG: alpha/beta hydrolase [Acidobacteria bacterium]|nr:alpha/beta hydrolase [Acidobacteriota bacterium]
MIQSASTSWEERWTELEGLKLRFEHAGKGSALVLVHGLLGSSFCWRYIIPLFARTHEVFAPDMPGCGGSDCRRDMDSRLPQTAERLLAFMDNAGIASCDLVGSSYGGAVALLAASLQPGRFRQLVLVSPVNPWSRYGHLRLALLRQRLISSLFLRWASRITILDGFFLRRLYGDGRRLAPETLLGYQARLRRFGVLEHAINMVRSWNDDLNDLKSCLARLPELPILVVWGSRDRAVDPSSARPLVTALGKLARLEVIEGAGHLPFEDCPEEFCEILGRFLCCSPPLAC